MLLPALRQDQQRFIPEEDRELSSLAQRRVYVGEFFEQATQALFGAQRLMCVVNADLCPDLTVKGRYLENKSIGRKGELVVRKVQLDRELEFKQPLLYVLWRHDAPVNDLMSRDALRERLAASAKEVMVIAAERIHELALSKPLIQWTQLGQTEEKCQGYRIQWRELAAEMHGEQDFIVWSVPVDRHKIGPITVRCRDKVLAKELYR